MIVFLKSVTVVILSLFSYTFAILIVVNMLMPYCISSAIVRFNIAYARHKDLYESWSSKRYTNQFMPDPRRFELLRRKAKSSKNWRVYIYSRTVLGVSLYIGIFIFGNIYWTIHVIEVSNYLWLIISLPYIAIAVMGLLLIYAEVKKLLGSNP